MTFSILFDTNSKYSETDLVISYRDHNSEPIRKFSHKAGFWKARFCPGFAFVPHDLGAANGKATVQKPRFSFSVDFPTVFRSLFVRNFSYWWMFHLWYWKTLENRWVLSEVEQGIYQFFHTHENSMRECWGPVSSSRDSNARSINIPYRYQPFLYKWIYQ